MATPIPENRAVFTLEELVRATRGHLRGGDVRVQGVVTDSRAVRPGSLFVALRGERHDAHRFLPEVAKAGAAAVVVHRGAELPAGIAAIEVDDTLEALGAIARHHRDRWGRKVVAITGSAGKTTTKELTRAALEGTGARVLATTGNLNNRIGVPMTILGLGDEHEIAVIEMGTSERGEIEKLGAIGRPDVSVVTLVSAAHTEGIGTVEDVAHEKGALFRALHRQGIAVANADDPRVRAQSESVSVRDRLLYGRSSDAHVRVVDVESTDTGLLARIHVEGLGRPFDVVLRIPGEVAAQNAAAALSVAHALGLDVEAASRGLASVEPGAGRMRPVAGPRGSLVLDDTYNADPRSMEAAIRAGRDLADRRGGRLLLALGDMKELGHLEEEAHGAVGELVAECRASFFVGVGHAMQTAVEVAARAGVSSALADDAEDAVPVLREGLERGDVLVVKGSRSMRMERIVASLEAHGGERP